MSRLAAGLLDASLVPNFELLHWDGCPSGEDALADLRSALAELGLPYAEVSLTEITTDEQAAERGFIGSPTLLCDGVDLLPPPPGEPTGLTCRVYRRRDGRYSPTPDPADLRDALRAALGQPEPATTLAAAAAAAAGGD